MLELKNIYVNIGPVEILRNVSMDLPTGSMTGLFGRNGAGKTSLLRSIMGALPLVDGEVWLDGVALGATQAYRRAHLGIGYMPEDRKLVPDLTCRDNIRIPYYSGAAVDVSRIDRVLELIPEVEGLLSRRASQLSGGQQKIIALARAFVIGSKVLLLDEPTEGVAPVLAARFAEILSRLKGHGLTILIAESDNRYVKDLVDRSYELERGEASAAAQNSINTGKQ